MKHGNKKAVGAHRDFFKMICTKGVSKMTIIDSLLEAKILPPPTQDVIFRRHARRQYNQRGGDGDDEDETASSSSEDSADEVDEDEGGEHMDLYEASYKVAEMVSIRSESDHTCTVLLPCVYAGGQDSRHQNWGGHEKNRCYKTLQRSV